MNNGNSQKFPIRTVQATRYVIPLREGGSLPAIVEADDDFLYVLKFRGAGQGIKALIAELIGGEIARFLGFNVPEIVFIDLNEGFGRTEPDEEIQDLLKASTGQNLGLHYLSSAFTYDPQVHTVVPDLASKIVWLDAYLTNVDRTARNTNMLMWNKNLWLIDHGAALYFHHSWENYKEQATKPFMQIKDHVLLRQASDLEGANAQFVAQIKEENIIQKVVALIPQEWLDQERMDRTIYTEFLNLRLDSAGIFVNEALDARKKIV